MSKIFQAFLSGVFFTFILDFFLFLGIKQHYIDPLEIDVYFNILFVDNQNIYLFLLLSIILGYITLYLSHKISFIVLGTLFLSVTLTLIPAVGFSVAERLLAKKDLTLLTNKFLYKGDIYYDGRKHIYFHDNKLDKTLKIEKIKIKELN